MIFILADDMGYGEFSASNGGLSSTPTLDGLLEESLCLTQHYAASPVCNPSRACLLTGRYPHRTGSVDTSEWRGFERLGLSERTLAEMLRADGYVTGLIGKWHLGAFDRKYHPMSRGFDETLCFRDGMHGYYDWRLERGETVERSDGRYLTDVWTEEAVRFVERHRGEPFCLHLTYNAPPPSRRPGKKPMSSLRGAGSPARWRRPMPCWSAWTPASRACSTPSSAWASARTPLSSSPATTVPPFGGAGEHCLDRFNCQFHGAKGSVYEGGNIIPLLVRWPGGLPTGEVQQMVHFSDWLPSVLAMLDLELPPGNLPIDGVNVLPVLRGEPGKVGTRRFWQWNRYPPLGDCNAAMRDGNWKLVRPAIREAMQFHDGELLSTSMHTPEHFVENGIIREPQPPRRIPPAPPPELYSIQEDPLEQHDLSHRYPEVSRRMLGELETWFDEVERERRFITDAEGRVAPGG